MLREKFCIFVAMTEAPARPEAFYTRQIKLNAAFAAYPKRFVKIPLIPLNQPQPGSTHRLRKLTKQALNNKEPVSTSLTRSAAVIQADEKLCIQARQQTIQAA